MSAPRSLATRALVSSLVVAILTAACGDNVSPSQRPASASPNSKSNPPSSSEASGSPTTASPQAVRMIEQPPVPSDVPLAPDSARVDLTMPTFSDPTQITNPLFPVSRQESVLMLGHVDDKPFRTEVTLLPYTRMVVWEGQQVETLVSQYLAYLDGRIQEIAFDLYAQADDGSGWYFGEDVSDFEDGAIVSKEGTWLAGKDAPAAMIMVSDPKIGDVFRTENSPGFAFEEVTVKAVDQSLEGPLGAVQGGIVMSELHMDGAIEDKTFAPGYGEFLTTGGGDVEALALAVPTDAAGGPIPADLAGLDAATTAVFEAAASKDWKAASSAVDNMATAWKAYQAGGVPKLIAPLLTESVDALRRAVAARDATLTRQTAIEAARSVLDLELRYRPATEIDLARLDLWAAQVQIDAAAEDAGSVGGDAFTLVYLRDRILRSMDAAQLTSINTQLLALQVAAIDGDFSAATDAATELRTIVAGLQH